jgi:TolB-like protein
MLSLKKLTKTEKYLGIVLILISIVAGVKNFWSNDDKINVEGNRNNINSNNKNIYNTGDTYINNAETNKKRNTEVINIDLKNETSIEENLRNQNFNSKKIVILPYEYLSHETKYNWLSKGIPETLPETFSDAGYIVVEGMQRDKILKEIDFQQGKYVDLKTAVKIGKLLGASEILIGSYQIENNTIIISSRIVNVESGEIIKNTIINHKDSVANIFEVEKNYANILRNKIK